MSAVASARPSTSPTVKALAPSTPTMNKGNRLWIISEEMSISMLTKPRAHIPAGICRKVLEGVGVMGGGISGFLLVQWASFQKPNQPPALEYIAQAAINLVATIIYLTLPRLQGPG